MSPHEHSFKTWIRFSHAPTGPPPEHTSFIVLLCVECSAYVLFPRQNFELCTADFKSRFRARATAEGWHDAGGDVSAVGMFHGERLRDRADF